ncbi:hypothetical protein MTO96_002406 [Rhipicephalus appendiculatus]
MDHRGVIRSDAGATACAAGFHRDPTPSTPMQPRLAGKLRRGKQPESAFFEDEPLRRTAKESVAIGALENRNKPQPKHSTERPNSTKAGASGPAVRSKYKQARNERGAPHRAWAEPPFANYLGWQPYETECPHEKGETDRCQGHRHMSHTQWPAYYYYDTEAFEPVIFETQMPEPSEDKTSDSDTAHSPHRPPQRARESSSDSAGTSVSGSAHVLMKPRQPTKSKDGHHKSSRSSHDHSRSDTSKDDSDDSEDETRSPRRSVARKDVIEGRSHAASQRSWTRKVARRSTEEESSRDYKDKAEAIRRANVRNYPARKPCAVHNSDSSIVQSDTSDESSDELSKKGHENAEVTARPSQSTVAEEQPSPRDLSKGSARKHSSTRKSESKSTHSKSSEKSGADDSEPEHHSCPQKPGETSPNRNSQDICDEPRPGLLSDDGRADRRAAEKSSEPLKPDESLVYLDRLAPSIHSASERSTFVSEADSTVSLVNSQVESEAKSSACTAAEENDTARWASSTSILTLINQVSEGLGFKQAELMAERTLRESATDRKDKEGDHAQMPPKESTVNTVNVTPDSTPSLRQVGNDLPVLFRQELCLYPLSLILVVAAVMVALLLFAPKAKRRALEEKLPETCASQHCLRDSVYLNDLLNWNFDPCDNFYMFVCSRWKNQFTAAYFHVSADDDYGSSLEAQIHSLLENKPLDSYTVIGPLQDLYKKCVNAKLIEDSGWDGLLEFMSELYLDGFPLTPPVLSSVSIWKMAARLLRKTETFTAIDGIDINDAIRMYTSVVFAAFKALRKEFIPPVHTLNVIKFASEVEKLSLQFSDSDARMETLVNASALQLFLAELFDGVSGAACTAPDCEVLTRSPDFIAKLVALVRETDLHTVMNFLGVRLMVQVAPVHPRVGTGRSLRDPSVRQTAASRPALEAHLTSTKPRERRFRKSSPRRASKFWLPAWIFNETMVVEYARRIPPTASERPLQSYAAIHEYNLVSSLTRPTGERWARSIFTTNCWYERGPRSIYVPMLLFNLTLLVDDIVYNFQLSRAGVRISHCLLDMLFAEANATNPEERWLNEATVAKIAEAQRCFGKDNGPKADARRHGDTLRLRPFS